MKICERRSFFVHLSGLFPAGLFIIALCLHHRVNFSKLLSFTSQYFTISFLNVSLWPNKRAVQQETHFFVTFSVDILMSLCTIEVPTFFFSWSFTLFYKIFSTWWLAFSVRIAYWKLHKVKVRRGTGSSLDCTYLWKILWKSLARWQWS